MISKRTRIWVVVAAAIVVGYPLAAWVVGFFVERQLQAREEQTLQRAAPYVSVVERNYRRGVYGATEVVTYGFGPPFVNAFKALPGADALSSFRLTIRNTVHHGPFPRMRTFALATVDTELVLPAEAQKRVDALLGRKSALASHTSIGWLGTARSEMAIPAFRGEIVPGTTVSSSGIVGTSASALDLSSLSGDFAAKGFTIQNDKGTAELVDLRGKVAVRRAFTTLNVGDVQLTVAGIKAHAAREEASAMQASMQQIEIDSHSSVKGDYVDVGANVSLGSVQIGKFAATQLGYALGATHLFGPSLASFTDGISAAARNLSADPQSSRLYQDKMQAVLRKDGVELLLHDPVVEISRIGFVMPEGALRVSAKATAPGLKRADFQGTTQATTAAVVKHLQAAADVRVDTGLLEKLTESNPNTDRLAAQTRALEAQGYITQDGSALLTHIVFDRGKLTLNGKPFPPTPSGPAGPPGPGPSAAPRPPPIPGPTKPPAPPR